MNIKNVIAEGAGKKFCLEKCGKKYLGDGFEVCIENDGKVFVCGEGAKLCYINIFFEDNFDGKKILGDAWERAYGDLQWKAPEETDVMPWYFAAYDGEKLLGYGVKTQPNATCSWTCGKNEAVLTIDLRNGSNPLSLTKEGLELCEIVIKKFEGDIFDAMKNFCRSMCDSPRFPNRPVFGGNDWYCCYGENSFEKIINHAKKVVECSKGLEYKPFMVIDDGWEICHHQSTNDYEYFNGGPWKYCNQNFGDMKKTAEEISKVGAVPGIWFRPLWTAEKLPKHYYLKNDGIKYTLDPSVPEVLNLIKSDVECIKNWGYKLIKHDFSTYDMFGCWGSNFKMSAKLNFFDKTKTTAQIMKNFYKAIREAAGDEVLIMGCNTLSHLSAGIFDIQRTGDDTSGLEWSRTKKFGINTLAFRMAQHETFYCVDADCVGITEKIPFEKNKMWLDVLAKSGTPLFVSIDEGVCWEDIKQDIAEAFKKNSKNRVTSKPLDWLENITPEKWESAYGTDIYKW